MTNVDINVGQIDIPKLVEQVLGGGEVILSHDGKPVARVVPYTLPQCDPTKRMAFGAWKGLISASEDFDAPDPELENLFYDAPLFPKDKE